MKKLRFPGLEFLIVVLIGILVWILGYPQYKEKEEINKRYRVMVNMYVLRAAIENYAAYNDGKFPKSAEEFKPYFTPPPNPYSDKPINGEDVTIFQYSGGEEAKNNSPDSKNGRIRGTPGGLGYGYFVSPGDSLVSAYGIIGIDKSGASLSEKLPSGRMQVLVIYE
jgi:hypothetical protein